MENLNAEQIINEIQSLIKALKDCGGWVKRGNGEGWFNHEILADALALINQLTEENANWEAIAEGYRKQFEDCAEERAKLTEENERLKTELRQTSQKLKTVEEANEKLTEENERLRVVIDKKEETMQIIAKEKQAYYDELVIAKAENKKKCKDCAGCIADKCDCANIEAYAVEKYKSAIIEYYSKPKYQPTKEHPIKHTQIEYLFAVLDQIAKEMLEGEK